MLLIFIVHVNVYHCYCYVVFILVDIEEAGKAVSCLYKPECHSETVLIYFAKVQARYLLGKTDPTWL